MVAVRMGDKNMRDLFAREAGEQSVDMVGEIGTRVDHRDLALPDNVCAGAPKGKGAGIARDDAADHRRDRLQPAVFEQKLATKRDLDSHEGEFTRGSRLSSCGGLISSGFARLITARSAAKPRSAVAPRRVVASAGYGGAGHRVGVGSIGYKIRAVAIPDYLAAATCRAALGMLTR